MSNPTILSENFLLPTDKLVEVSAVMPPLLFDRIESMTGHMCQGIRADGLIQVMLKSESDLLLFEVWIQTAREFKHDFLQRWGFYFTGPEGGCSLVLASGKQFRFDFIW